MFREIGVVVQECDIKACHRLRRKKKEPLRSFLPGKMPSIFWGAKKDSSRLILPSWVFLKVLKISSRKFLSLLPRHMKLMQRTNGQIRVTPVFTICNLVRMKLEENGPTSTLLTLWIYSLISISIVSNSFMDNHNGPIVFRPVCFLGVHVDTGWFDLHYRSTHSFLFGL